MDLYFTDKKLGRILEELKKHMYPDTVEIGLYKMKKGNFKGGEKPELDVSVWDDFRSGDRWGEKNTHYWFRTKITIPEIFKGKTVIYRVETGREGQWDALNPQFFIYVNDKLIQGLDVNHREIEITDSAVPGKTYTIALYAYTGMLDGSIALNSHLLTLDKDIEKLYYNIKVPLDVTALLKEEDKNRIEILNFLNDAVNMLDLRKPFSPEYYNSINKANEFLEVEFYQKFCKKEGVTALCVGHTHIDIAWLWTIAQTREKAGRSFSTVLNLMESYPNYTFMSSQPQLYKFVKEDYPLIYDKIRKRIKEGRWEAEGAMWLEADCNISSGEALIRQILFGTRFFEREFGVKTKLLWLPDVFGYSAALPQILKKSGIEYFITSKISWNEYNKLPYDTFLWRGIDGSEILSHFITTCSPDNNGACGIKTTYNGNLIPSQIYGAWQRYQQKNLSNEVIIPYGYGDGGGGPTKEMLEYAKRLEKGIPGCPAVKMGNSLGFMERLKKSVLNNPKLPRWVGELYLEYHRGTYTSMARNKKYNRKSEFLLQDVEFLSAVNKLTGSNEQYPRNEINQCWELVLLNQFHDILPGSSIKEVYDESQKQYLEVFEKGRVMLWNSIRSVAQRINLEHNSLVVFNQLGFSRSDVVEISLPDGTGLVDSDGKNIPVQKTYDGKVIFFAENVPAKGYKAYKISKSSEDTERLCTLNTKQLNNRFFEIRFDDNFNISSVYDKRNKRELIQEGCRANVIQAFEDMPHEYDAWDINIYYQDKMWEVNDVKQACLIEDGPVRTVFLVKRKFLDSTIVQTIILYNNIPRIDFKNHIDWKESQILLKAAFPVDINADKATYEIQYGNVERPVHWNTSWDFARFEVCAHKWADLSEDGYGVSLLNDCKYGYDIKDGVMRLTLLKSATYPNNKADREIHEFTYSLYPHDGSWRNGGTVQMAYSLNCPMYSCVEHAHPGSLPDTMAFFSVKNENVILEVVKKAEDSEDIIIRLYECYNRRTQTTVDFFKPLREVWECDMMENDITKLPASDNSFEFEIKPYEIKTFRLKL